MVHAAPMRWHDRVLGGLNLFWRTSRTLRPEELGLAQAFADLATVTLMQPPGPDDQTAVDRKLRIALRGRVEIERAKGVVLAQTAQLAMDEAFARLVQLGEEAGQPLTQVARTILNDVAGPRP